MILIWIWIAIGLLAILGTGLVIRQAQRSFISDKTANQGASLLRRNVFTLQLGDIVQWAGTDWAVEGRLTFHEGGYEWFEYMLQEGDRLAWLTVEEDDIVEVYWMETVTDIELNRDPPPTLDYQNVTYRQTSSGVAEMTRIGTTLNKQAERCRYFDYASSDSNQCLGVEIWEGDVEISVGQRIRPSSLRLLPGDGQRVYGE
jgi:Domain of unknown function (DUF4178)